MAGTAVTAGGRVAVGIVGGAVVEAGAMVAASVEGAAVAAGALVEDVALLHAASNAARANAT